MIPVALTIAGSDPSGGAGLQADLKAFTRLGVHGAAAVTLITVQDTLGVHGVEPLDPALVERQVTAVVEDLAPAAAKTGALGSADTIRSVARCAARFTGPLVVDPVMVSKHGHVLLDAEAARALADHLLPRAAVVTPNLAEARALAGREVRDAGEAEAAARAIAGRGPQAVLLKGVPGEDGAVDLLLAGGRVELLRGPHHARRGVHGSGCTLAAALCAELAHGTPLPEAARRAKAFTAEAIAGGADLGRGIGPVNPLAARGRG